LPDHLFACRARTAAEDYRHGHAAGEYRAFGDGRFAGEDDDDAPDRSMLDNDAGETVAKFLGQRIGCGNAVFLRGEAVLRFVG
jgi:hypothetical protein